MSKPTVAIFDFACCEGCQLQIVNLEEEILDLISIVQPVEWREAMSEQSEVYDVAIVEGSITRPEDEERIRRIRDRAKVLVALGACATTGGVNRLKNNFAMEDVRRCVYGSDAEMPHLDTAPTRAVHEVVTVDCKIHGCPVNPNEMVRILRALVLGKTPVVADYPVCVECKARENVCRWEFGEVCLGPITRAGCEATCPSAGSWCFGCRDLVENPNVGAAREVMEQYGLTVEDLKSRAALFCTEQEPVDVQHG